MSAGRPMHVGEILVPRYRIAERVESMGRQIAADVEREGGKDPRIVLIPVMTGALVFAADLIRAMPVRMSLGLLGVSSYPGASTTSQGVALTSQLPDGLAGAHVVVVDDVLDSGRTLSVVRDAVRGRGPVSIRFAVLLRKPATVRAVPFEADYVGFDIPNEFVVGYGLDHDGAYRNLPDIAVLRPAPGAWDRA